MKKIIIIGSGIAGLSASATLAKEGLNVTVLEKNATAGGRARKFEANGFVFDMGPSWYWMPDVFEKFFQRFGKQVSDCYDLVRLDPSYRIFYKGGDFLDVPAGIPALCDFFEKLEPGSSKSLLKFLDEGAVKYSVGMNNLAYKPRLSMREFADRELLGKVLKLHVFQSLSMYVRKFFKNPKLIKLLEFPVLFLGAAPERIPALYSLMNYADMALGTWYPMGGMYKVIESMVSTGQQNGVRYLYNSPVSQITLNGSHSTGVLANGTFHPSDVVIATADYRHVEKDLLPQRAMQYSDRYWNTRVMAPSSLIFYLGIKKRISNLLHHTLFFDEDIEPHIKEIYTNPGWPSAPQFYVCCPSKTDPSVAPPGCENLFVLIPVASGLRDEEVIREKYFEMVISRIERLTGETIKPHIIYKRSYAHNNFISDYNAFKGNAYGLANTLRQTANFKPAMVHNKIENLFFAGQLTVPGPGVPPSMISGEMAAAEALKKMS